MTLIADIILLYNFIVVKIRINFQIDQKGSYQIGMIKQKSDKNQFSRIGLNMFNIINILYPTIIYIILNIINIYVIQLIPI